MDSKDVKAWIIVIAGVIVLVSVVTLITQWAWNAIAPVFSIPELSGVQTLALLVLISILGGTLKK